MKTNRKALLTSIVSLIICVTMLIGTTFAWFTDTASTKVSKIQAGTLKVELWGADVTEGKVGELANIGNKTQALFNYNLWEPGYTSYKVVEIKNVGNLAFEYALDVIRNLGDDGTNVPTILPDVIDVYYNVYTSLDAVPTTFTRDDYKDWGEPTSLATVLKGDKDGVIHGVLLPKGATADNSGYEMVESVYAVIALHMQESAGNDYMDLTEKFDIKLYAKQWTEEYDSQNNTYDANAVYKDENGEDRKDPTAEEEKPCEHTETKLVSNNDGTHNEVCAAEGCDYVVRENVPCDYTHDCKYLEERAGTNYHKNLCECGDYTEERCSPVEGECTKCHHDAGNNHSWGDWISNNDGTHTHECQNDPSHTETENCTYGTDHKCTKCDYKQPATPATLTSISGTVNIPGVDVSKLSFILYRGSNNLTSPTKPDANGNLTFTGLDETLTANEQYDVKLMHSTYLDNMGITGVSDSVSFTVEVSLNETTNAYEIKAGTDSFEYKSGCTYTFSGNTVPTTISTNFGDVVADSTCTLENGVLHVGTYNAWGYSCNHNENSNADNPPSCGTGYSRWNQWARPEFDLGTLPAGTYTVSCKLMAKDIKSNEHTPDYSVKKDENNKDIIDDKGEPVKYFNGNYTYILKQDNQEFGFRMLLNDKEETSVKDVNFEQGEWKTITLTFTLAEETSCKIQVDTHIDFGASYRFDFYLDDFTVTTSN